MVPRPPGRPRRRRFRPAAPRAPRRLSVAAGGRPPGKSEAKLPVRSNYLLGGPAATHVPATSSSEYQRWFSRGRRSPSPRRRTRRKRPARAPRMEVLHVDHVAAVDGYGAGDAVAGVVDREVGDSDVGGDGRSDGDVSLHGDEHGECRPDERARDRYADAAGGWPGVGADVTVDGDSGRYVNGFVDVANNGSAHD